MSKIEQFEKRVKELYGIQGELYDFDAIRLAREIWGDSEAQGKELSRDKLADALGEEIPWLREDLLKFADDILQAGGIPRQMELQKMEEIIYNRPYTEAAKTIFDTVYGKGEEKYYNVCQQVGCNTPTTRNKFCVEHDPRLDEPAKHDGLIMHVPEKPQEYQCGCDRIDEYEECPIHGNEKPQEKVGKVEPLYFTYPPTDEATLMCKDKINEVIKRLNDHLS